MAGEGDRVYIVDTSSWITIEHHPAENWILYFVSKLIEEGRIICPPEVWDELKQVPRLKAWLEPTKDTHIRRIGAAEYFLAGGRVTARFPVMAAARANKEKADQWVIAMALYLNEQDQGKEHVVVSQEGFRKRQTIPKACVAMSVPYTDLLGMLRHEFPDEGF
jgi:hypothetical protein